MKLFRYLRQYDQMNCSAAPPSVVIIMKRICFKIISLFLFLPYCSIYLHAQNGVPIEVDSLKLIEVHVIMETGESDGYIPGMFGDLIVAEGGSLIVSDRQNVSIEQYQSDGTYKGTVAREGNGPGEVPFTFSLIDAGSNGFLVWKDQSLMFDFFKKDEDGNYNYKYSKTPELKRNQRVDLIGYLRNVGYLAFVRSWRDEVKINLPEYKEDVVVLMDEHLNLVQDSLHIIKTPNHIFKDPARFSTRITMDGLAYLGLPPFRFQDQIRILNNNHYAIARPGSALIQVYNSNHKLLREINLNIQVRKIRTSDLNSAFENHPVANNNIRIRNELKTYVGEFKPPFLDVWISDDQILLYTEDKADGKEMVLLAMDGKQLGKFYLPQFDEVRYLREGKIYSIHKNPLEGHSIRVYEVRE